MDVRLLNREDAAVYRDLRLKGLLRDPMAFSESYEDEARRPQSDFARFLEPVGDPPEAFTVGGWADDRRLIGIASFRRDTRSKARHKGMISAMSVDRRSQRMGIGGRLLTEILARCRRMPGLELVYLWALHSEGRLSAAKFYRRFGFESQGMARHDLIVDGASIDAEYLVLYLDENAS